VRRGAFAVGAVAASYAAALACGTVTPTEDPPPSNTCPAAPCDLYEQTGPVACVSGLCAVPVDGKDGGPSPTSDIVLTVSMPVDGTFAPGRTFVLPFDSLHRSSLKLDAGILPGVVSPQGYYYVTPAVVANEVHWNLDSMAGFSTSLPVHATFQPILLSLADGTSVSAASIPIDPVAATAQEMGPFGPSMGPGTLYVANDLQPGIYVRTVTPDPPFDQAFGPSIAQVQISDTLLIEVVSGYDTIGAFDPVLPATTISRERGSFDGWTAYLLDKTTNAVISNVAPLSGARTSVTFAVRRLGAALADGGFMQGPYALSTGTAIVLAPPTGSVEPTYVGSITNSLLLPLRYPTLPAPVLVQGAVQGTYGEALSADLVFEAVGITNVVNGLPQLDKTSFRLTRWVSVDATPDGGPAQYSVVLPPGEYRFDVRPRDRSHALLVRDLEVPVQFDTLRVDVSLGSPTTAAGSVAIADGRPLAAAVVEARPTQCAQPAVLGQTASSAWCLPRPAQTTTNADGGFSLDLDPGQYQMRTEPAGGSRLPWGAPETLDVTSLSASDAGTLVVPAPLSLGMALVDPTHRPVANAVVRAYRTFPSGPAVELGTALTDAAGRYELYVAPAQ
jgi:hypothetical protein